MRAVRLYEERQAANYAANHDLGPLPAVADDGYEPAPAAESDLFYETPPEESGSDDPTTMQEEALGDLDCDELAESDFDPIPGDPHGLDADGDGTGCES